MKILEQTWKFQGRRIAVRQDRTVDDSGLETTRDVVVHPGAVCIIALPSPDEVVLTRQYRYATGKELLELPAGTIEESESPIDTAHRELEEETGYRATRLELINTFYTTPGFCDELMYLYEGDGLSLAEQHLDANESIQVVVTRRSEAFQMIRDGRIQDAKTLVGLLTLLSKGS
jgi:ADP-ribose pyrophosphatase